MHENLVRAFYSNALCVEVNEDGNAWFVDQIITFVMGRNLVVNQESIAWVSRILDVGDCNEEHPFPNTIKTIKNQVKDLSFENRILLIFISHVLRPFEIKYSTI